MSDRYQSLIHTPVGQLLAKNLGLPNPVTLDRWTEGPLVDGTVVVGGDGRLGAAVVSALDELGIASVKDVRRGRAVQGPGVRRHRHRVLVRPGRAPTLLHPAHAQPAELRSRRGARHPPESTNSPAERVAQRALEGFTRSLGKEIGRGSTVQLVYVAPAADAATASTLGFLLSPKSAYVSGQVVRIGVTGATAAEPVEDWTRPLAGKVALVTGASRASASRSPGCCTATARRSSASTYPRLPARAQALMTELDGDHLTLDITTKDALQRIGAPCVKEKHGGVDVVVHNAGITRDKKPANMPRTAGAHDRGEPDRAGADHRRAAEAEAGQRQRPIVGVASIAASPATWARPTTPRPRPA